MTSNHAALDNCHLNEHAAQLRVSSDVARPEGMNMCDKSPLALYRERIQRLAAEGFKLLAYNCHYKSCGKEIIDAAAQPGERKELLSSCPHCSRLFRKTITHDEINTWLTILVTDQSAPAAARSGPLAMPLPNLCSDFYAAGWAYGDTHISRGGSLYAEAGPNWHEDKAMGFWDRLSAERKRNDEVQPLPHPQFGV